MWWCAPVVSATRRLRRESRLGDRACSEPRLCHCTPAWAIERDSVSKKKRRRRIKNNWCSPGQVQWLMPVIPALHEAKAAGSPEIKSSSPTWAIWWNLISTKNTKLARWGGACPCNPSYSGGWGRRVTWTREAEVAVHCTPAWATRATLYLKKTPSYPSSTLFSFMLTYTNHLHFFTVFYSKAFCFCWFHVPFFSSPWKQLSHYYFPPCEERATCFQFLCSKGPNRKGIAS